MTDDRVARWAALLIARHTSVVSLNDIGDVIGAAAATPDDIEALFLCLETAGRTISTEEVERPQQSLRAVLRAARALKARGETASTAAIARETGLSQEQVRGALLFAQVLQRSSHS